MSANVRLRVSRFATLGIGLFVVLLGTAPLGIAATGTVSGNAPSADYNEAFCGTPPADYRPEPVVLPPHTSPMIVNVAISGFAFDPPNLTINVGDTVMWTNQDGAPHTSTSDTAVWNSGTLSMGQSFSFTFNSTGTFPYFCGIHSFMTASITVVAAPSPTPTPAISGTITYGISPVGPPPPFVSNVLLSGAGSPDVSVTTVFPSGSYTLTGFGAGSYTVTPSKTGGVNGISSFDAGRIAQHAAGITILSANQLVAADTSGNGTVSSFDAAQIARFAAGISGIGLTGTWKFLPVNRSYASVTSNVAGEDFIAILMGEVSGNWVNTAP